MYFAECFFSNWLRNLGETWQQCSSSPLLQKLLSAKAILCCAAMLLCDEDDICTVAYHSVIFNSVSKPDVARRFPMSTLTMTHIGEHAVFPHDAVSGSSVFFWQLYSPYPQTYFRTAARVHIRAM